MLSLLIYLTSLVTHTPYDLLVSHGNDLRIAQLMEGEENYSEGVDRVDCMDHVDRQTHVR
jgi:hypothetical protein